MKILYLMHVDWNWIKQRPHFLAEELGKNGFDVDVLFIPYQKKFLVDNVAENVSLKPIKQLRGRRFSIIRKMNSLLYKIIVKHTLKTKDYDYVYITHPSMYVTHLNKKIIYDCMDDNAAFSMSDKKRRRILETEKKIIQNADIVLFSAEYLSKIVIDRIGFVPKTYKIINNAIKLPAVTISEKQIIEKKRNDDNIIITYIGTVSNWFDLELLRNVQKKYSDKNIIYNLYGPVDYNADFTGFNLKGPVPHERIFDAMLESDILIMPFVLNDLIKSVNPVKLYEYIYSGKPIISIEYGETIKFSDYIYLYKPSDTDSFINCLNEIKANNYAGKQSLANAQKFVYGNTWAERANEIISIL